MKTCTKCQTAQPTTEFWKAKHTTDGLQGWCKTCSKERVRQYGREKPEQTRESWRKAKLKHKHDLTPEEYDELLERQGGVCAICARPPGEKRHSLDHNHRTDEKRGILCFNCNVGLGHFQDDPKILLAAAEYLS